MKEETNVSVKTFDITLADSNEVVAVLRSLQNQNQISLDISWDIDDQISALDKCQKGYEKYSKEAAEKWGVEKSEIHRGFISTKVPSQEDQNDLVAKLDKNEEPPVWWALGKTERLEGFSKSMEELGNKKEKVTVKPIKYSDLESEGLKVSTSLVKLRNRFIIKD